MVCQFYEISKIFFGNCLKIAVQSGFVGIWQVETYCKNSCRPRNIDPDYLSIVAKFLKILDILRILNTKMKELLLLIFACK